MHAILTYTMPSIWTIANRNFINAASNVFCFSEQGQMVTVIKGDKGERVSEHVLDAYYCNVYFS